MVARETKDFAKFAPVLEEWVALTREACALIDASRPAYDVRLLPQAHAHTHPDALLSKPWQRPWQLAAGGHTSSALRSCGNKVKGAVPALA